VRDGGVNTHGSPGGVMWNVGWSALRNTYLFGLIIVATVTVQIGKLVGERVWRRSQS